MHKMADTQKVIDALVEKFAPKGEEGLHRWVLNMMAERSEHRADFMLSAERYVRTFGEKAAV